MRALLRSAGSSAAARRVFPAPPVPPLSLVPDLHLLSLRRSGQSAMNLFTDMNVGDAEHILYNGGPPKNGPNAGAWTVYWGLTR